MAVIKSGSGTDQLDITAGKTAKVTLYNADGTIYTPTITVSTSTLAQEGSAASISNIFLTLQYELHSVIPLLTEILMEMRIHNALIVEIAQGGGTNQFMDIDKEYRNDPYFNTLAQNRSRN